MQLIELKGPRPRFARSINVERDAGSHAIDGYLPVGRALDALARLVAALADDEVEVAISITGPYGSGKSSLALLIDALFGPATDPARRSADELLEQTAPAVLRDLDASRRRLGVHRSGFVRAVVTAQREPIAATILRGLADGAARFRPPSKRRAAFSKASTQLQELRRGYEVDGVLPEPRQFREVIAMLGAAAPVLLLVDEFGKNLEAFADSQRDADLHLLQELAEWTRGNDGIPLALVTLQHMAFEEYATTATAAQRREWAKIQGRFEDVPFVDSPAQTRALIAAAFEPAAAPVRPALSRWGKAQTAALSDLGLNELSREPEQVEACWPLHPTSLAVLPDLCERYGQNERTLFSFLAGHDRRGVRSFLREQRWDEGRDLPCVRLDRLYDYFLESAATMVGVSSAASRWVEIDTRIRDAARLDDACRRVLKAVGLLNLVSAGGAVRASRLLVQYAMADGEPGTATPGAVEDRLDELEEAGLITFRDFADEYRVWQGTDFDLRSAVEMSRRRLGQLSPSALLERVLPLTPVIAGRHSHRTGTLRVFERGWVEEGHALVEPLGSQDHADGSALLVLGQTAPTAAVVDRPDAKPVAFLTTGAADLLVSAALEVAALDDALNTAEGLGEDWVARKELHERRIEAQSLLSEAYETAFGPMSAGRGDWIARKPGRRSKWTARPIDSDSHALSQVADEWYLQAPRIRNDLVNRTELSSQAAKARRLVLEAMVSRASHEGLGIEGNGPDHTLYLSVLQELGFHRPSDEEWHFTEPPLDSSARPAWDKLVTLFAEAQASRLRLSDIYEQLAAPPFGVRPGVVPVLVVAGLIVHAEEVALYEHGTFRPVLSPDLCERLLRNPSNFEIKHFASKSGVRAQYLTALADALGVTASRGRRNGRVGSVLAVLSHLVALTNGLPEHAKRTRALSPEGLAVRRELLLATEPDELLFRALPEAVGCPAVPGNASPESVDTQGTASKLAKAIEQLRQAYPALLEEIRSALRTELRGPELELRESLAVRARELQGKVVDQRLARLLIALAADLPGDDEWTEYVGMNLIGNPPASWSDDDRHRCLALLHELGGTFRRIEALNADVRSRDGGFDALRVAVTSPDGQESVKLVWIDDVRREAVQAVAAEALANLADLTGSEAESIDLLIACLAASDLASGSHLIAPGAESATYSESKSPSSTERTAG